MAPNDTPYVFREPPGDGTDEPVDDAVDDELVIVDGRTIRYRRYEG